MKFPAYVPAAAREYFTSLIDGNEGEQDGLGAALASAEQRLSEIEQAIEVKRRRGEIEYLVSLRRQESETRKHRDALAGEVDCLRRLAHDARMRDAYALLISEVSSDEEVSCIIDSAWSARLDYGDLRERLKQVNEQKEVIACTADKLARELEKFSTTGVVAPAEFHSVRELLRKTDNDEWWGQNREIWKAMRKHVTGDAEKRKLKPDRQRELDLPLSESEGERESKQLNQVDINIQFVKPGDSVAEQDPQAALRYAWEKAPPVSGLLKTLAQAARDFKAREEGLIGVAIDSRQGSVKADYLRAFAYLLITTYNFSPTNRLMRAMAIIANVAINSPDVDVTCDDVRKVVAGRVVKPGENSR